MKLSMFLRERRASTFSSSVSAMSFCTRLRELSHPFLSIGAMGLRIAVHLLSEEVISSKERCV